MRVLIIIFLYVSEILAIGDTFYYKDLHENTISIHLSIENSVSATQEKTVEVFSLLVKCIKDYNYAKILPTEYKPIENKAISISLIQRKDELFVTVIQEKKRLKKYKYSSAKAIVLDITTLLFGSAA